MDLTVALSTSDDRRLLDVAGVLDYASMPYLRHIVFDLFDAGARDVTVDVSGLRIIDAASIKVLLYLQRRAVQLTGDLRLTAASGTVLTALEIAGVAKQLGLHDEVHWPPTLRQRRPVDLVEMHLTRGYWPAEATGLLMWLRGLPEGTEAHRRAREQVIEVCLPAAHQLARRFAGAGEPVGDLAQVAALGLVKAVDGFDAERGVEFGMYATPSIVGEIKRYFRDRTWGIRMPRRLQELRMSVNAVRDGLTQQLGRSPNVTDLALALGVDEEQVIELIGASHAYRPLSLSTPLGDDEAALIDLLGVEEPAYGLIDFRETVLRLIVRLPDREQRILSLRFFGNLTQQEIAEQVGLSQMHVSRLLRQSLAFLRRRLTEHRE